MDWSVWMLVSYFVVALAGDELTPYENSQDKK